MKDIVDWAAVLSSAATLIVIIGGFAATRPMWLRVSLARLRSESFRANGSTKVAFSDHSWRAKELIDGKGLTVAAEMRWLTNAWKDPAVRASSAGFRLTPEEVGQLSRAYETMAARLRQRVLISASTVEAIRLVAAHATQTSDHLSTLGLSRPLLPSVSTRSLELPSERGGRLHFHSLAELNKNTPSYDLVVSTTDSAVVLYYPGAPWGTSIPEEARVSWKVGEELAEELEVKFVSGDELRDELKVKVLSGELADGHVPHIFDGVLPRIAEHRTEYSQLSGRSRIHLNLGLTTYGSVVVDHYPGPQQLAEEFPEHHVVARGVRKTTRATGENVKVLTLTCLPVTSDGYALLSRRSATTGSQGHQWTSAINGNLELAPGPTGRPPDLDEEGLPSPLMAICREAQEEMGLRLREEDVFVTGLVQFDSPTENGTFVLTSATLLPFTLAAMPQAGLVPDAAEGRWESTGELLAVPLPRDLDSLSECLAWWVSRPELTPQATAAALAVMSSFYRADVVGLSRKAATFSSVGLSPDATAVTGSGWGTRVRVLEAPWAGHD